MIYGVPFHNVTFEEAVEWIIARVRSGRPANIATANLDFVMRAWRDPELQRILIDADLVLADGFPIVKLSPFFGTALKARVTGSDLTPMLAERAAKEGICVYGLGAADGVAEEAMRLLKEHNPALKVVGTYSPPYAPLLEMDHREVLRRLEKAAPDILFVALGAPKQDKFISMHVRGWNIPVSIGVGGSLDFITGTQKRAPAWMRKIYLEWLWRLCLNPKRRFARYSANIHFLMSASKQMWQIHRMPDRPVSFQHLEESDLARLAALGLRQEYFRPLESEEDALRFMAQIREHSDGKSVLLDIHSIPWLNSLELGTLLEINKQRRAQGKRLILYALRPKVRRLLETCRLTDYFDTAIRLKEVETLLGHLASDVEGHVLLEGGQLRLDLPIELTAATLPAIEEQARLIHDELELNKTLKTVLVDAGHLDFIDSSGLGFLIALKKTTQDAGVSMSIVNMAPKPRHIFEIARVDKTLLHA